MHKSSQLTDKSTLHATKKQTGDLVKSSIQVIENTFSSISSPLLPKPESWGRQQAILGSPQHPIYNDKSTSIRETHKSSLIFDSPFVVPLTSTVEKAGVISTEKSMLNPLQRTENTAS